MLFSPIVGLIEIDQQRHEEKNVNGLSFPSVKLAQHTVEKNGESACA